jgi:hypothetical protein
MAFNLNKNEDSNSELDSSKKSNGTSKFDLSKNENVSSLSQENNKKSKTWLFALIGLVLLGGAWYFLTDSKSNKDVVNDTSNIPTVQSTAGAEPSSNETNGLSGATTDTTTNAISNSSSAQETTANAESANSTNENTKINNNSSVSKTKSNNNDSSNSVSQGTIEEKAKQVINGVFGNGVDRKRALGDEYAAIQARVNELYRNR